MLNKDKRSFVLMCALGDGCIHYIRNHDRIYGGLTIAHSVAQADYLSWKVALLNHAFNKDLKIRFVSMKNKKNGFKNTADQYQYALCAKRIRAWRRFCYPKGKKSIPKILKFIRHPELAVSIWLGDDGYAEPSFCKKTKQLNGAALRLYTCDQSLEQQQQIIEWFQKTFDVTPKVAFQNSALRQKSYPFLKFNSVDSLKLWKFSRKALLRFESMAHKFRHMEERYLYKVSQPASGNEQKSVLTG